MVNATGGKEKTQHTVVNRKRGSNYASQVLCTLQSIDLNKYKPQLFYVFFLLIYKLPFDIHQCHIFA